MKQLHWSVIVGWPAASVRSGLLGCLIGIVLAAGPLASSSPAATQVLREWDFNQDRDLQGWAPNGHLREVAVTNGALVCAAAGSDPILELRSPLEFAASPWQQIEVRLKASRDGAAEFFWSNTAQGRYGGFSQEKTTRFRVTGDGQWHLYRLLPFWHPEGKIVRLRFDVFDGAQFEVDFIRIVELTVPAATARAEFDFTQGRAEKSGWQTVGDTQAKADQSGLIFSAPDQGSFLLSPPLQVDAAQNSFIALRLAVTPARSASPSSATPPVHATLFFATTQKHGLHSFTFPVEADGHEHTYNLDLLGASDWRGRVVALGLRPSDRPTDTARLCWLKVSEEPQGPPELKVVSFAVDDALPRAGMPATLTATVANTGGEIASNLQATLTLPPGVQLLSSTPADARMATLGQGEEAVFTWKIQSPAPRTGETRLQLTCGAASPGEPRITNHAVARLDFAPRIELPRVDYVPGPKPVRGSHEVGVYYFPGWKSASQWHPIQRFPERKPVLGWYREGNPEVADWHIKYAVEHGITFFAYDWYWSRGTRQLEHALHDGYFKARYRHLLKFCLLWANHNPPNTSSPEDCLAVTRYWIENYFRRPEHLTFEGKPVVIIFSMDRLTHDLGSAGVRKAFDAMRAECQRAGLKGLYLIACVGDAGGARAAAAEGYDAVTAYNWPHLGMTEGGMYAPFETLLGGYRRQWEHLRELGLLPLWPLPVCGGWDSRPWHGENNLVRYGRTPELFKRHLQDARAFLETQGATVRKPGCILVEAWNEWGEGSYIEPHREFGFGYLDAIREIFTDAPAGHVDVTPADAGLGPYDVPPQQFQTVWNFERGDEGWNNTMDLTALRATNGTLVARTTGNDPALFGPPTQARAGEFGSVVVRLKLEHPASQSFKDTAQLFWRTSRLPESEASSARFEVVGDGQWHEYHVPVAANRRWRGVITRLRLDPGNQAGVQVHLDSIRFSR